MYSPKTNFINSIKYEGTDCVEADTGYISPCWIWRKAKSKVGYGMVTISRKQYCVHVLNYIDQYGSVPDGLELDHLCSIRACVKPDHLEAVTHTENVRRGGRAKLTEIMVIEAKRLRDSGELCKDIALSMGVDRSVISEATRGVIWKVRL